MYVYGCYPKTGVPLFWNTVYIYTDIYSGKSKARQSGGLCCPSASS